MSSRVIRINERVLYDLREMAEQLNQSQQAIIEQAVEEFKRKKFFEEMNAAHAKLRSNPEAWEDYEAERQLWEGTLADGLEKE